MNRKIFPAFIPDTEKWSIENNLNMLVNLLEGRWEKLTEYGKLDIAQIAVNIEGSFLGLPPIWLKAMPFDEPHVISMYSDMPVHMITLNTHVLNEKDGKKVLSAVLHECRHCFQHQMITIYDVLPEEYKYLCVFHEVPIYKEEFENYHKLADRDGENSYIEDVIAYSTQFVEVDARNYAALAEETYISRIESYIEGKEEE